MRSLTGNALWNIIGRVVPLAITFFITPFLILHIGTSNYGLYMLIMSISGVMGVMSFGLGDATLMYVAHYHMLNDQEGINRIVRSTLFLYLTIGLLVIAALNFFAPLLLSLFSIPAESISQAELLLRISAICFAINLINGVAVAIIQGVQRYDLQTKNVILAAIFQAIATIVVIKSSGGLTELIFVVLSTNILSLIINIMLSKRILPQIKFKPAYSATGIREVTGYGFFSFLTHLFGLSFSYSDRLIIGSFVSSSAVGFLTVPQDLALRALSIVGQGGAVLFPKFSSVKGPAEIEKLYINATWVMLMFSIIIFAPLTVFMKDFISLWISNDFAEKCSTVGQLIAFSSMVRGAFIVYQELFKGVNKPQYVTAISFCVGITSLLLNFILIPKYGLNGAGYSYCATTVWGFVAMFFTWKYFLEKGPWRILFRIFVMPLAIGCIAILMGFKLQEFYPPTSWPILFAEASIFILGLSVILGCSEVLFGGKNNCAAVFSRSLKSAISQSNLLRRNI